MTAWREVDETVSREYYVKNKDFRFVHWATVERWKDSNQQLEGVHPLTRVRREQLKCLIPGRSLNNFVMEGYFKLVAERTGICWLPSLVYIKMVQRNGNFIFKNFLRRAGSKGINRIFWPICYSLDSGLPTTADTTSNHWVLAVAYLPERKIYISSSFKVGCALNTEVIRRSFGWTFNRVNKRFTVEELATQTQDGFYDCGVCVLMVLRCILLNGIPEFLDFSKENMILVRRNILREFVYQTVDFRWGASSVERFACGSQSK